MHPHGSLHQQKAVYESRPGHLLYGKVYTMHVCRCFWVVHDECNFHVLAKVEFNYCAEMFDFPRPGVCPQLTMNS